MIKRGVLSNTLMITFAGLLLSYTFNFPDTAEGAQLGTAFFPRLLLIGVIVLCLLMLIKALNPEKLRFIPSETDAEPDAEGGSVGGGTGFGVNSAVAVVLSVVYLGFMSVGFYFWATPLYIGCILWMSGIRDTKTIALTALGFLAFSFIVFYSFLNVPLLTM